MVCKEAVIKTDKEETQESNPDSVFLEFMLLITNLYTISAVLRRTVLQPNF